MFLVCLKFASLKIMEAAIHFQNINLKVRPLRYFADTFLQPYFSTSLCPSIQHEYSLKASEYFLTIFTEETNSPFKSQYISDAAAFIQKIIR